MLIYGKTTEQLVASATGKSLKEALDDLNTQINAFINKERTLTMAYICAPTDNIQVVMTPNCETYYVSQQWLVVENRMD